MLSVLRQVHSLFPKRVLRIVRSTGSSSSFQYRLFSLRSSSSCLPLLHSSSHHFYHFIFPSITCFRRQFLHKMWPIQLAFLLYTVGYFCLSWLFVILFSFLTRLSRVKYFLKAFGYIKLLCLHFRMYVLSCSWVRQLSRNVPADVGFIHNKASILGDMINWILCTPN